MWLQLWWQKKPSLIVVVWLIFLVQCRNAQARVLHVAHGNDNNNNNNNNTATTSCTDLTHPCTSIQQAVDLAENGDQILVQAGIYAEHVQIGGASSSTTTTASSASSSSTFRLLRNVHIQGAGMGQTIVTTTTRGSTTTTSSTANAPLEQPRPAVGGLLPVAADNIIFDVWSENIRITNLTIRHVDNNDNNNNNNNNMANAPDIGVHVGPTAFGFTLSQCHVERVSDTPQPGSRGIVVVRGQGTYIFDNIFTGPFEDHIQVMSTQTAVFGNTVWNATRLGIVLIQEMDTAVGRTDYNDNDVNTNTVRGCGGDGIQVQTDDNVIARNVVQDSGGAGIQLCGLDAVGDCVAPYDAWADAFRNIVIDNDVSEESNAGGGVVDNGSANTISTTLNAPTAAPDTSNAVGRGWWGWGMAFLLLYRAVV